MNLSEVIGYIIVTFIGSFITIMPYIYEKIRNLTKHKKITIIGVMMIVFMSVFFTLPLFPIIPPDSMAYMIILLMSLVFAAYLSNVLSYFYSPTKSELILLKEHNISIENRTYAIIKYFKEEFKSYSNYVFWGLMISVLFLGINFSIVLQLLIGVTVEDEIPIIIFLIASIIANLANIVRIFSPVQYYVKYICTSTNEIFEGFKLDKNTVYNSGKIIEIPLNSQIIEERIMEKYLCDRDILTLDNEEIEKALKQLNKIDIFLYIARRWYKIQTKNKKIKNRTTIWLLRQRLNKNKKVWKEVVENLKVRVNNRNYLMICYEKIKDNTESLENVFEDCNLTKTAKEAPENDGMGRV